MQIKLFLTPIFWKTRTTTIEHSIPRSNINYLAASENINICEDFFKMLNEYNPNLLGGLIPDQEFYEKKL